MSPQSHAHQLLETLYRRLLGRARDLLGAQWPAGAGDWSHAMEELPRRMLFSITPVGGEFLLDTATANVQSNADVAVMSSGASVSVWTSANQDGSGDGVFGRMFDASGSPLGAEFQINQQTSNNQDHPRVAADASGKFVVTWTDSNGNANVFARLYNADGTPAGNAFQVNTTSSGTQENPDVAVDSSNGNFIIAWDGAGAIDSSGIYARSFQSDGTALSGEVLINSTTSSTQISPAVAINASGNAIITWTSTVSGITKIAARRVGALTAPVGAEFAPGVPASGDNETDAAVAIDAGGNFLVAFDSHSAGANTWDVFSRRYNSSATALDASPVAVNTTLINQQQHPSVAMLPTGEYLIAWDSQLQDGSNAGIYAQLFAADGSRDGSEFLVNTTTSLIQQRPATAWVGSALMVAWDGNGTGDADGVFAQLFASNVVTPNQPPVITVPSAQTTAEDTALIFSAAGGDQIKIDDANAGSFPLKITLGVSSGALTLAGTSGLTFSSGDGTADATIVFTGTLSAINAALDGLTFTPAADANGAVTLGIAADDLGNGGTGGAMTDSNSVGITVTAVNDAPAWAAPSSASANEDTPLVFSSANGNAIALADVDAGSADLQVMLATTSGTLTLASVAGLNFTTGDGAADASMTFTGTLSAINADLAGLTFTPAGDTSGAVTISLDADDQGNSGAGGDLSGSAIVNVTVTAVNDAPSLSGSHELSQIDEDDTSNTGDLVSSLIAGKITDIDGPASGIAVTAVNGANGTWQFSTNGGASWTNFGNVSASAARLLASDASTRVRFVPDADFNGAVSPGITFRAWDQSTGTAGATANASTGGGSSAFSSATASADVTVRAINDAPVNTVPSNVAVNEDAVLTFSGSKLISVADVDAGTDAIDVSMAVTNGTLTLAQTTGLSFSIGDGTGDASMYFSGTLAAINAALNGMTFTPDADFNGFAGFAITSNDKGNNGFGGPQTDSDSFAITVNAVNDPPVNTIPSAAQSTAEDTPFTFSSSGGNAITVDDIDATTLRVTLHATNGVVTLPILSGLTMVSGDGTLDKDVTFDGTAAAINAAMDGLVFTPSANFNGAATLQVVTSDRGQTGSGGTLTDTDSIAITVSAVNDAPTIDPPASQSVLENTPLVFNGGHNDRITIADVDAGSSPVQLTLTATHGVLTLASISGLSFTSGDGTADATMVLTGAVSAINNALNGLTFTPAAGYLGNASVQVDIDDQGNTGAGGALTDSATVPVEVVTEFRANTVTDNTQFQPTVAIDPSGNFVAVWAGNQNGDENSGYGIWAQLYDNTGTSVGGEIHVNLTTANDQLAPSVGMDSAGNFVVAWASNGQDGNGWGVYARRYSFDGTPLGGEIAINTTTSGNQDQPTIAVAPDGSFVVAWRNTASGNTDVFARRFNSNGVAAGGEFRVNTNVTDSQDQPAIATSTSGDFVIAWRSNKQDGSGGGVFARLYDSAGNALTGEIQGNVTNSGNQDKPAVSMAPGGSFVISWASGNDQDGDKHGIYTRRFDASGNALSGEFLVNTTTVDDQNVPTVAVGSDGAFVVAWSSNNQDGSGKGIYAQKFDASGATVGGEFRVSGTTFNNQDQPAAALSAAADLVVLWQGNGIGDTSGVFGQFYRSANHAPLNSVPAAQTINEDTPLTFSSANGNAIVVGGGAGVIQVSLAVSNGVATLAHTSGLVFIVGDGSADGTITIQGTQSAINAALAGLRFDPEANFNGLAQLRITTTDSSSGNTVSDQDTVSITVAPVNDAPTTSGIANVNTAEDAADIAVSLPGSFSDVEDAATALAYTIAGDTNLALFDSVSIDPTTHEAIFRLAHNANGSSWITIRATDSGGLFVQATFAVNVNAVNDAPVLVADAGATIDQGATLAITTAMLQITDVDNTTAQLTYAITSLPASGALELSGTPLALGQTFTQADIDAGLVAYRQSGTVASTGASDAFGFSGSDGAGGTIAGSSFSMTISAAPALPPAPPPPPLPPPGPATPPDSSGSTTTSSSAHNSNPPPTEVDTTGGNGGEKSGGGGGTGSGSGTSGGARGEAPRASGSGSSGSSGNAAQNAAQAPQDAAPPLAAKPAQSDRDAADANAKAQQLAQKDNNISVAGVDALRQPPPPPPVAAPVPVAPPPPPPAAPVAFISQIADAATASSPIAQQLDEMHKQVTGQTHTIRLVAGSATVVSLGLSVLYILWTIRAGYLLAGLLSSMPAWTFVDPLPILDHFDDALRRKRRDEDGESLETLVKGQTSTGKSAEGALS